MITPLNRHLVVEPIAPEEKPGPQIDILLPEDVTLNAEPFTLAKIRSVCRSSAFVRELKEGAVVVVPTHMIQEATFYGKTYYLVTENNIIGVYADEERL